jgi:putative hydrolase
VRNAGSWLPAWESIGRENVPPIDFHMHTNWTDGTATAREMHDRAGEVGLKHVLFSEHVRKESAEWFPRFAEEIRALPASGCRPFVGVETRVADYDGSIDCAREVVSDCDFVLASVHRLPGRNGGISNFGDFTPEEAVDLEHRLAEAVLDNPDVDILGHAFGMCFKRYKISPPEELIRSVIKKSALKRVAFEVNVHYHPEPWKLIEWCREAGAIISLGSDAHTVENVGRIGRVLLGNSIE